ncbi:molybdopterin converting factor small subunit [Nakamurella sp. UYEF19]|uniref:MoaD/ThiS family protein n=1 Tax=Nakamurella sp. UYEF19 TaxID=1756392 RepID=UPI003394201B
MDDPAPPQAAVTVRFFAAARAAAGLDEERILVSAPATVGDVLEATVSIHGAGLAQVLRRCSYLLDETAIHGHETAVTDGDVLDVLPPFAGG